LSEEGGGYWLELEEYPSLFVGGVAGEKPAMTKGKEGGVL
jgi:hypothetical protein